ncbi:iron complex transport system permease protein [Halobacillus alkaliphilus]|uniref:Iron complex transport system permease protein n=1 Tax=Halobacillus alkaliphilus TaxID=396056 RepID=A0A1I2PQA3_9BACI|nr:iron ABC transporter permease [Halobacillus alkaliphilus]SFG18435.1 iron complex transport system permease protein [Halobacillus alkaliphilus]
MNKKQRRFGWIISILGASLLLLFLFSLNMGVVNIAPLEVIRTLLGSGSSTQEMVLFDIRLPKMMLALLIGAGLGVSGAILQGVSRNDLADPGILGINTGAGFAIIVYIFFFQGSMSKLSGLGIYAMPLFALAGAFLAAFLIYLLAWKKGINPVRLILVGIGVNSGFSAALIIFQVKMNPQDFTQAMVWLAGDIWGGNWDFVAALAPWIILLTVYAMYKASVLNILNLGDQISTGLGAAVEKERRVLLALAVALAGLCVAAGGGIAFLGLVAPHLARRLVGPKHETLIPVTALIGALILLAADTVGKNLIAPAEIPVGIVVTIVSTPYFIYLLMKTH